MSPGTLSSFWKCSLHLATTLLLSEKVSIPSDDSPRFSRSVPLLKSLHWLPVHYRIIFKMCTIAYQALSSTQPAYLNSMLTPTRNSRQLRSTSSNPLHIPRVKTKAGTRAFSVAAPAVWNSLPASVKSQGNIVSFRRHLKTYLFNAAYPP